MKQSGFINFSKIGKECPRCGEENDKCGMFEDAGFVMCRTDMGDSIEPKLDAAGWEYWPFQVGQGDRYHDVYSKFHSLLSLSTQDQQALISRGLSESFVKQNYRTIPHGNGKSGLNSTIKVLDEKFDLSKIPGFYLNEGSREANAKNKQTLIPVRNFAGRIVQFILRNNGEQKTKKKSKYVMFSSYGKDDGEKLSPAIHFPLGVENCTHEVRLTEGILKADVATQIGSIYTIGMHGLSTNGVICALEMLGVSRVRLCLDIDWKENRNVLNGLRRIYTAVCDAGFEVVVEEWNHADGKGIDDVLLSKGKIWEMPKEDIEFALDCPKFDDKDWVYIDKTSEFVNTQTMQRFDEKQFDNYFCKFEENFSKRAKVSVRHALSFTYMPLREEFINEDNYFNFNLWKNDGIEAVENKANLDLFFEHVNYLFPNDDEQKDLLLDWMANIVQHRGKKFSYALVLHGEEGTGKSWIVDTCLSLILGKSNVETIKNNYINGQFNSMMQGNELLLISEVMALGRREFMNEMKDYIDRKEIMINTKGIPEYKMPFHSNWFMTTNYDDALLIDDRDRRYLVLSSPAECGDDAEATERGKKLFSWSGGGKEEFPIQEENLAALHHMLLNRKVKSSPFAKAPSTKAKALMQEESMSALVRYISEGIESGDWPFDSDLFCPQEIRQYPEVKSQFPKETDKAWAAALKECGAIPYGSKMSTSGKLVDYRRVRILIKSEGRKRQIWFLRRQRTYSNLKSTEVESLYLKKKNEGGGAQIEREDPL